MTHEVRVPQPGERIHRIDETPFQRDAHYQVGRVVESDPGAMTWFVDMVMRHDAPAGGIYIRYDDELKGWKEITWPETSGG